MFYFGIMFNFGIFLICTSYICTGVRSFGDVPAVIWSSKYEMFEKIMKQLQDHLELEPDRAQYGATGISYLFFSPLQ